MTDKFALTLEGYIEAREWLKAIGKWEWVAHTGWSDERLKWITKMANTMWERRVYEYVRYKIPGSICVPEIDATED